MKAILWL